MARQYQKKQHLLKQINEMLESGMTQREIADELGLTGYRPVHELLKREREIAKLKMENMLLRDFLQSTERM